MSDRESGGCNGGHPHFRLALSRRELLQQAGAGFGSLALTFLLAQEAQPAAAPRRILHPLAPKPPMLPAKAKSVICLFMYGGVSHVDTFDPKPELAKHDGLPLTGKGEIKTFFGHPGNLMKSPFQFGRHGQCGREVSELFPHLAGCVDDLCFIRSIYGDSNHHAPALLQMNTGSIQPGCPSLGSWVTCGLGTENQDLPAFVVMTDPRGDPIGGAPNWSSSFLPAAYQGTVFRASGTPILDPAPGTDAGRMQSHAPEVVDLSSEPPEVQELYGLNDPTTEPFGRKCLLARRLVERGVRFVQIYSGGGHGDDTWDAHSNLVYNHRLHAGETDKPIASLLTDLKRRGLLDQTLVVWGSEFGRMPISQGGRGRDHNPGAQTVWLAGGGVKPGTVVGATDEVGYKAAEKPYHVRDLHATLLHLMGLDDMQLTSLHNGRFQRLTTNGGQLIKEALG